MSKANCLNGPISRLYSDAGSFFCLLFGQGEFPCLYQFSAFKVKALFTRFAHRKTFARQRTVFFHRCKKAVFRYGRKQNRNRIFLLCKAEHFVGAVNKVDHFFCADKFVQDGLKHADGKRIRRYVKAGKSAL